MVPAILRQTAREDGVWGVLAAAGTAAALLAALALALDLAALAAVRTDVQSALDAALVTAAHEVVPSSVPSNDPQLDTATAAAVAKATLSAAIPATIHLRWLTPPAVQNGSPSSIIATVEVTAPMPALIGSVSFRVQGQEAVAWLPQ